MTRLLGFDLLPRIKQINKVKLYRIESGESELYGVPVANGENPTDTALTCGCGGFGDGC